MSRPDVIVPLLASAPEVRRLVGSAEVEEWGELPDASSITRDLPDGRLVVVVWREAAHQVVFQTPQRTESSSRERLDVLMHLYGEGHAWNHVLDNGFGDRWHRADGQAVCLHGRIADFTTFKTQRLDEAVRTYQPAPSSGVWLDLSRLGSAVEARSGAEELRRHVDVDPARRALLDLGDRRILVVARPAGPA
jgi:hypothetical protein